MTFTNNDTFNRYTLGTNPNIIIEQSVKKAWDDTRDYTPLLSFLHLMEGKTKYGPKKAKKIHFGIGDYFSTSATLGSAMAYNATQIVLTEDRFFEGDVLYLYDTAISKYAFVRLNTKITTATFYCTIYKTDAVSGSFATATTQVTVLNSSVPNDGKARNYLNKKGDLGLNYMQRGRDTVGMGQAEASEEFIIEHDLPSLTRKGFRYYAEKKNLAMYFNMIARGGVNEAYESQISGGLPYFYNPHGTTFADSGIRTLACDISTNATFKGQNKVISGSNFTYSGFREWLYDQTLHGTKDKIVALSGQNFLRLVSLLEGQISINDKDLRMLVPSMPSPWAIPMVDFGVARVWFMLDRSIDGKYMPLTVGGVTADKDKWMVSVDPNHIGYVPLVMGGKTMTPQIASITAVDNDSVEKVEYDSFDTLVIDEPRSGGYLGLYTGS